MLKKIVAQSNMLPFLHGCRTTTYFTRLLSDWAKCNKQTLTTTEISKLLSQSRLSWTKNSHYQISNILTTIDTTQYDQPKCHLLNGEKVFHDSSGWHAHSQHILYSWDIILATNTIQIIQIATQKCNQA